MTDFYYRALGAGRYQPTLRAQGAWRPDEQHMSPLSGLLVHCLLRHEPRPDLQLARISFEILGMMPIGETVIRVETVRPGRTIELLQATAVISGREVLRANAWFLATGDTAEVAGVAARELPHTGAVPEELLNKWGGGFIASLTVLSEPDKTPGASWSWLRSDTVLVDVEPIHPSTPVLMLADTANGVAFRLPPTSWSFPNIDLTIHLLRPPTGEWLGVDVCNEIGPTGVGITSAVLHDVHGPFGRSQQILTIRPLED
ncbi:MAG: thioesterase family protein [Propionibacteriaceae bacterium]|nr:thioesterase family protein [Propionibacteriaceae bacterium]